VRRAFPPSFSLAPSTTEFPGATGRARKGKETVATRAAMARQWADQSGKRLF